MNLLEALNTSKEIVDTNNGYRPIAVVKTQGHEHGDYHIFTVSYDNSEENDDGTRDFFTVHVSSGTPGEDKGQVPSPGRDFTMSATSIEGLMEEVEDYKLTDILSKAKFNLNNCEHVEGYIMDYALKIVFPHLVEPDVNNKNSIDLFVEQVDLAIAKVNGENKGLTP